MTRDQFQSLYPKGVSSKQFAVLFSESDRTVRDWARDGVVVQGKQHGYHKPWWFSFENVMDYANREGKKPAWDLLPTLPTRDDDETD
jgi:phage terminase Nu1 subunit (DNA packaging protein)